MVSNRPLTAELAHSDSFERYDIALPVNATEYVQTRMALTLQVENEGAGTTRWQITSRSRGLARRALVREPASARYAKTDDLET